MKHIQIRNVPEKTHSVLRRRANAAGMSLQEYLLSMVNEAASKPTVEEVLRRAGRRTGGDFTLTEAVEIVRKDRNSR